MLGVGTALFGMFFFLTLLMQGVWGYSAPKTGVAYLPLTAAVLVASGAASRLASRIGASTTATARGGTRPQERRAAPGCGR